MSSLFVFWNLNEQEQKTEESAFLVSYNNGVTSAYLESFDLAIINHAQVIEGRFGPLKHQKL